MFTPKRIYQQELLDAGEGTDDDVAGNLLDLRRVNRFLGGKRAVMREVLADVNGDTREISLLDVGTGSADIPSAIASKCKASGLGSVIAALDMSERNLRIARTRLDVSRDVSLVRGDALMLPFADDSFDFVTASHFLHHFREEDVVRLLTDFARVARRAVIILDLVRGLAPYYLMQVAGAVLATSPLTRADGPVSVLRGFTAAEFRALAAQSGLKRSSVRRVFPYHLLLVADVSSR